MMVNGEGIPVAELIAIVKNSVKRAGISRASHIRDLRISSVQLTLRVVANKSAGGRLDFQVPFIGMNLGIGAKVTQQDTHTIAMSLAPPEARRAFQVRGGEVEDTLVRAIETIRETMTFAATGEDPWILSSSTVDLAFAVTRTGSITLGAHGELSNEVTHILRLSLIPSAPETAAAQDLMPHDT